MKTKTIKHFLAVFTMGCCFIVTAFITACSEDIDESNLYVFNGQTIEDYLKASPEEFSNFNYILSRIGYDQILASYGTYTCFAPNNEAVEAYVDSLYNDMSNPELPHNGMTAPGLEGLTDSLCNDIALYHLLYTKVLSIKLNAGATFSTILRRDINASIDSLGNIVINNNSKLLTGQTNIDIELENGILHKISHVFTRSNNMVGGELERHPEFSIFYQALMLTSLADTLMQNQKTTVIYPTSKYYYTTNSQGTKPCYTPDECKIGFTIFAEPNDVLNAAGIYDWESLVAHAKEVYENCATSGGWYDYYRNNGIEVSTGNDYENPNNVVNMWLRYHIVKQSISNDHLAYYDTDNKTAETPAVSYYETLLPKTLIRVSLENRAQTIFKINHTEYNSTLTDGVETRGSAAMHGEWHPGVEIEKTQIQAMNGYIHPVKQLLEYTQDAKDAFRERMRFDSSALFGELQSNGFRKMSVQTLGSLYPEGYNSRIRIPNTYFDNFVAYNDQCNIIYLPQEFPTDDDTGPRRRDVWEADEMNIEGAYDCAIRLPPVPDGTYEIRLGYKALGGTSMSSRGMMQIFLGDGTTDINRMEPLDIPLDMRRVPNSNSNEPDAVTGWINPDRTDDKGVATDVSMRYLGFMRAPIGMLGGTGDGRSSRKAGDCLRRILTTRTLHQGDYWLRFKRVLDYGLLNLDYIEIVPDNVYNNSQYSEDMF